MVRVSCFIYDVWCVILKYTFKIDLQSVEHFPQKRGWGWERGDVIDGVGIALGIK